MMKSRLKFMLALVLALTGCTAVDDAVDGDTGRTHDGRPGFEVAVAPGETLDGVARRLGVSRDMLIEANRLHPPYELREHQVLYVPPPATYRVQPDDTVEGIAVALGVDEAALAAANGLYQPYHMRVGQILRVPGGFGGGEAPVETAEPGFEGVAPPPRSTISAQPLPPPGMGVNQSPPPQPQYSPPPVAQPPMSPSSYSPPYVPAPEPRNVPPSAPRQAYAPPTVITPQTPSHAPQPASPVQIAQVPVAISTPAPPAQTPRPVETPPPAEPPRIDAPPQPKGEDGAPHFLRPVAGPVAQGFGPDASGQTNEGINISAPAGTPVRAAAAGTVIYAGNELQAFGNLLLIRHEGGWVTAYGHLDTMNVQRGATVTQGETIGTVGQTGSAKTPQLHFEVRQGSKPVDPAPFLKS
jgi:murein DD-endopeptidase MepM/ murein hydrolase activator NlpD